MNEERKHNRLIGEKLIETAISFDESLVEILRIEVQRLKKCPKSGNDLEELRKTNNLIKNIIIALTITDEKLKTGMSLCMDNSEIESQ